MSIFSNAISKLVASFTNHAFLADLAERVLAGAILGASAALTAGIPFSTAVTVGAGTGALSVLKGIVATQFGKSESASIVGASIVEEEVYPPEVPVR